MAEMVHCERCGEVNPTDARFCIECGYRIVEAQTGPTVQLSGRVCEACRSLNPEEARFCAICGSSFDESPQPSRPAAIPLSLPQVGYTPAPTPAQPAPAWGNGILIALAVGIVVAVMVAAKLPWLAVALVVGALVFAMSGARGRMPIPGHWVLILGIVLLMIVTKTFWPWLLLIFFFNHWGGRRGRPW